MKDGQRVRAAARPGAAALPRPAQGGGVPGDGPQPRHPRRHPQPLHEGDHHLEVVLTSANQC